MLGMSGEPEDLSGAVRRGARSTAASQAFAQALRLATTLILARLLSPAAFGVISLAMVVIVLVDHLKDLGTGPAIIQRQRTTPGLLDAVFLLNIGLGTLLAAALALTAEPVATLLGQPTAAPVLAVMGLLTLVTSFGQTHQALLRRKMEFSAIARFGVIDAAVASVVSVVLAVAGLGVWSIVYGTIGGALVSTLYLWRASPWRPRWAPSLRELGEIWRFSMHLFAANLAWFVFLGQADKFVVGRWLGLTALGVYSLAQRAVSYPLSSVGSVVGQVLYPALSRLQGDTEAMGRVFTRASASVAMLLFPAMAGVAIVASPAVTAFLGPEWKELAPLVWILAPAGAIQAVTSLSYHLTTAVGRTDWTLRWQLVQAVVYLASYFVGIPWGVTGVAWSYGIACVVLAPIGVLVSLRTIDFAFRHYLAALAPTVLATVGMCTVALTVGSLSSDPWLQLALAIMAGMVTYITFMLWLRPEAWSDGLTMLRRRPA